MQPDRSALTRRRLLERSAVLGAALTAPGLLAGCGGSDDETSTASSSETSPATSTAAAGEPKRGGRMRVGISDGGPTETLTPFTQTSYAQAARVQQLYERLFAAQPDFTVAPRLAESVEANSDSTVWQMKLKSGITFHSGKTMTAADVLYSLAYVADPKNKAESLARLEPIDLKASKQVSDTEIEFVLKRPIGDFARLLSEKGLMIVPDGMTDFSKPDGTGAFTFVEWEAGVRTLVKRNDQYWGEGGPYVDEVELLTISDNAARVNALLGGQIDQMTFLDFVQGQELASNDEVVVLRTPAPQVTPITMKMDVKPFDDPKVREAFRLAVDRQAIVDNVLLGFGAVSNDLFGKGFPSYNDELPQREHDPERATALLKEAGQEGIKVTLPTSSYVPGMLESAGAFKEQAKAAGIEVTLEKLPADSYFGNDLYLKTGFYQTSWGQAFESQAQDGLVQGSPYNETGWNRPEWDTEFRRAQGIADDDERNRAYKDLQVPLHEEGGYIIWGQSDILDLVSSKVKGVVPNGGSGYNLAYFEFKDQWIDG